MAGGWRLQLWRAGKLGARQRRERPLSTGVISPNMVSFAASTVLPVSGRVQCLRSVRDRAALAPMLVMLPRLAPSQMRPENRSAQNQGDAQGDEKRTTNVHVARRVRRGRGEFIDGGWVRLGW